MVLTQGFFNNMRSMTTGWYSEKVPLVTPPPSVALEARPDIAKALKTVDPPAREIIELRSVVDIPDEPGDQSQPELPLEVRIDTPATPEERRKRGA
jgi:hypothetical protein